MQKIFLIPVVCCFLLCACSNSQQSEEKVTVDSLQQNAPAAQIPSTTIADSAMPVIGAAPAMQQQPATATAAGMNPAHGEPNHRCDIPVGAPLNSPPGQQTPSAAAPQMSPSITPSPSTQPAVVATPSAAPPVEQSAPVVTLPGMNPPHGEPGHDCSIKVGEPLKKKE